MSPHVAAELSPVCALSISGITSLFELLTPKHQNRAALHRVGLCLFCSFSFHSAKQRPF